MECRSTNSSAATRIHSDRQPPRPTSRIGFLEHEDDQQPTSSVSPFAEEPHFLDPTEEELDTLSDIAIDDGIALEDDSIEDESESQDILAPLFSNPDTSVFSLPNHHGPSRSHLMQLKSFWAMREGEWDMKRAYDGVMSGDDDSASSSPSSSRSPSPPPGLNNTPPNSPPPPKRSPPSTPLTMHPRRGDILALRDPYCLQADRCFAGLPLWTMSKTFFMFDLHIACKMTSSPKKTFDSPCSSPGFTTSSLDHEEEEHTESTRMHRTMSTGDSSDSDVTLVDSGSEDDLSPIEPNSRSSWLSRRESSPEDWETWETVSLSDQSDIPSSSSTSSSSSSESLSVEKEPHPSSHISTSVTEDGTSSSPSPSTTSSPSHGNTAQESKIPRPGLMRRQAAQAPPTKRQDSDSTLSSNTCQAVAKTSSSVDPKEDEEDESDDDSEDDYSTLMVDEDDPFVWSKDWYRRWDLLTRLVRLDQTRKRSRC